MDPTWFYRKEYLANGGNFKPALWYKFYNNSEEAINWIIDIAAKAGIKTTIESGPEYKEGDPMFTPPAAHAFYVDDSELKGSIGNGEGHIAAEMGRYVTKDLGVDVRWNVKGEQLVRGGVANGKEGRVDAIIASDADGAYTKYVGTKAVIMATGDFSHDKDMMERYCPQAVELCDFTTDINYDQGIWMGGLMPGDGHKMELWVGGAWQKEPNNIMGLGRPNLPGDQPYTSHTGLMVDNMGQRFMNEDALGGLACATIMHLSEKTAYCIWGANRAEAGGPWGAINYPHGEYFTTEEVIERWDTDADGFGIVKADTREEVISKLGLPAATIDTVERYNKMCEAGVDTDFYKTADKLISIGADDGPFYGASLLSRLPDFSGRPAHRQRSSGARRERPADRRPVQRRMHDRQLLLRHLHVRDGRHELRSHLHYAALRFGQGSRFWQAQLTRTHPSSRSASTGSRWIGSTRFAACVRRRPCEKACRFWQVSAESEATLRTRKKCGCNALAPHPHQGGDEGGKGLGFQVRRRALGADATPREAVGKRESHVGGVAASLAAHEQARHHFAISTG